MVAGRRKESFGTVTLLFFLPSLLPNLLAFVPAPITSRHSPYAFNTIHHATAESQETDALDYVDRLLSSHDSQRSRFKDDAEIVQDIHSLHALDYATAASAPLVLEETHRMPQCTLPFEWLENNVAVQSLEPLLARADLEVIRKAAETIWSTQAGATSRFTYQYEGNFEAHVSDFATTTPEALKVVNRCLQEKLYPWIRQVFFSNHDDNKNNTIPSQLFVYDALVIRYNATASKTAIAGQPLHRDLGIVSVNIMLNDGFQGGGTYFENQQTTQPLKPSAGPGHALAHYSYERHAGAGTYEGVRDILVFFVSAKEPLPRLLNARLKQGRERCSCLQDPVQSMLCRIRHQRLAVETALDDGEAFQYLGTALYEYSQVLEFTDLEESTEALRQAIQCYQHAQERTPRDSRVYNNWGLALAKLEEKNQLVSTDITAGRVYQKGFDLLLQAEQAGCLVSNDLDSLSLNYGLYLANQDKFLEASVVLERTAAKFVEGCDNRIWKDALGLWKFCCRQLQ